MDWEQIETKWFAMARRVRADCRLARVDGSASAPDRPGPVSNAATVITEQQMNAVSDDRGAAPPK